MPDPNVRYYAHAHSLIPLDDPHEWGNDGLEGHDESGESRVFPTRGLAVAWLGRMFKKYEHGSKGGWFADGFVERQEWDGACGGCWCEQHRWYFEAGADKPVPAGEESFRA